MRISVGLDWFVSMMEESMVAGFGSVVVDDLSTTRESAIER